MMDYLEMLADHFIREAEEMTANTCAKCGIPLDKDNKVETKGWITYLCRECDKKVQPNENDEDDVLEETQDKESVHEEPAGEDAKVE